MSGAGKSTVLDSLEDMGWDVVDNLPADLLEGFVHGGAECRTVPAAVGMDVRSRGFDPAHLADAPRDRGRPARNPLPRLRRERSCSAALTRRGGSTRSPPTGQPRTGSPGSGG